MCCHCEMYLPHSPYSTSKSHSKCKSSIISPLLQKHYNPLVCFGNFKIKITLSRHFYGSFFFFKLIFWYILTSLKSKCLSLLILFFPFGKHWFPLPPHPPKLWINQKLTCLFCSMTTVTLYHLCPHSSLPETSSFVTRHCKQRLDTLHKATFTRDKKQSKHLRGYHKGIAVCFNYKSDYLRDKEGLFKD